MSRPPLPGGPYLIVGLARSGVAAALALASRGETVIGTDRAGLAPTELDGSGVELVEDPFGALERVRCLVKSPGVDAAEPLIVAARERGIAVLGELEAQLNDPLAAAGYFRKSLQLAETKSEQLFLSKRLLACDEQIPA